MSGNPVTPAALPQRIANVLASASKVRGASWLRIARQAPSRSPEPLFSMMLADGELGDRLGQIAIVEQVQIIVRDDLAQVCADDEPPPSVSYVITVGSDDPVRELARDAIRIRTSSGEGAITKPGSGIAPGGKGWEEQAGPTSQVTATAILRQQYRHNEALVASHMRSHANTIDKLTGLIGSLSDQLARAQDARFQDAEKSIHVARAQRTMEAEARSEEMRAEALKLTAGTLAEWLPVALHKIARKYGLSGDDSVDPILEKMVQSFTDDQIDKLGGIFTPVQRELFADVWLMVNDRVKARKAKAEAEAKKKAGLKDAIPGVIVEAVAGANGKNGAA